MGMGYYKWMKIYIGALLVLLIGAAIFSYIESQPKTHTNRRQMSGELTVKDGTQPLKKGEVMYCNLGNKETLTYLTSSEFRLNGMGYVKFDASYVNNSKVFKPTKIIISKGSSRFEGDWELNAVGNVLITNYRAISGNFYASTDTK